MNPTETVILCEGYHDRAFWKGWLEYRGCQDAPFTSNAAGKRFVQDPFGSLVEGGQYAYSTPNAHFVKVRPCMGKEKVTRAARIRLDQRNTEELERLVINVDNDSEAVGDAQKAGPQTANILALARTKDPQATMDANGDILIDGGATKISLVRWETNDAPTPGVPNKQTLERLVCASIVAAYPQRGQNVQDWLEARHDPPTLSVKEYSWSLMAGWRAESGCDDFLRSLWDDDAIAAELKTRLESSGAWRIVEEIIA